MSRTVTFTSLVNNSTISVELEDKYKIDKTINAFGSVISIALSRTINDAPTDRDVVEAYKKAMEMTKLGNIKVIFKIDGELFMSEEAHTLNFGVTDGSSFFISDKPNEKYILESLRINLV